MLKGETVVLTGFREADREPLFAWMKDPGTVRFNAPYIPLSWAAHGQWFDRLNTAPDRVVFAIRLEPEGQILGTVQLVDIHRVHRSAELTIRIGAAADRGRGLGSDAVRTAVRFAFADLNLQRVWLRVFASNLRAVRAYERAGFTPEGTLRRAAYIDGEWVDEIVMAVLRPQP